MLHELLLVLRCSNVRLVQRQHLLVDHQGRVRQRWHEAGINHRWADGGSVSKARPDARLRVGSCQPWVVSILASRSV